MGASVPQDNTVIISRVVWIADALLPDGFSVASLNKNSSCDEKKSVYIFYAELNYENPQAVVQPEFRNRGGHIYIFKWKSL